MVTYLKDKIRGMPFTTPGAGDDGKYIKYVHGTPGFILETPTGGGDVVGPASSVNERIVLFDGVTGKLIKDAGKNIADLLEVAAGDFNAFVEKVSPANADIVLIEDSAASYAKKKVQVGNLPGGSGSSTWLGLTDTPGAFDNGKLVKSGAAALSFGMLESDIFKKDGTVAMTGDLDINSYDIQNHGNCSPATVNTKAIGAVGKEFAYVRTYIGVCKTKLQSDVIDEITATAGVTIDSCLIKDGKAADSDKVDACHAGVATGNVFKIPAGIAQGDIFYVDVSGHIVRLAAGTNGHFLKTQGAAANPIWATGAGNSTTWLGLTDTPSAFTGQKGMLPRVNTGETALEFKHNAVSTTFVVAANDAKDKLRSDYVCNASADQTEINNAVNALPT